MNTVNFRKYPSCSYGECDYGDDDICVNYKELLEYNFNKNKYILEELKNHLESKYLSEEDFYGENNKYRFVMNFYNYNKLKDPINYIKKNSKINKEELCKEAFKPFRLLNRMNLYGDEYTFIKKKY